MIKDIHADKKMSKSEKANEIRWKTEQALDNLRRAEEVGQDPDLINLVDKAISKEQLALNRVRKSVKGNKQKRTKTEED